MGLTASQLKTLREVCDTFFLSLTAASPIEFYRRKASDFGVDNAMAEVIETRLQPSLRGQLVRLLGILDSPFYNLVLTGKPERFSRLSTGGRERYMQKWRDSPVGAKRGGLPIRQK